MDSKARQLNDWANRTLFEINVQNLDTDSILNMSSDALASKSFEEVHNIVTQLAQYNIFLTNELNKCRASYKYYENAYKERLSHVLTVCTIEGKSKDEREGNANTKDTELAKLVKQRNDYKVRLERLDGLPYTINTYLSIVQQIFKMKLYEKRDNN